MDLGKNQGFGEINSVFGKIKRFWENLPNLIFLGKSSVFLGKSNELEMNAMLKKNFKGRCEKMSISKSKDVCRTYSEIQKKYVELLEKNNDVLEIRCNVLLDGLELGDYTSDFVCVKSGKDLMVRECVSSKHLMKGKFTRSGLKVNKLRYRHDSYTEMYLVGGDVTVAYNPEDVTNVWLIEKNGKYVEFDLIDSRFEGTTLADVQSIQLTSKELVAKENEVNLQAKVDLAQNIEAIIATTHRNAVVDNGLQNIRQTRRHEQQRAHKDLMNGGDYNV